MDCTLVAVGDAIITRHVSQRKDPAFVELAAFLRSADVSFANLEIMTPVWPPVPSSEYGGMHLAAPTWVLDELKWLGFNLFGVANNHAIDYTVQGLVDTLRELEARDMVYAGGGPRLGDARSPAYLERAGGRVALISCASTYMTGALAAESRTDMPGRPGINPLRYRSEYVLAPDDMEALRQIDEALGTARTTKKRQAFGMKRERHPGDLQFVGKNFFAGESTHVRTRPDERDVEEICRWIKDAREQSDFVVVSLHAHEGPDGDSNSDQPAGFIIEACHAFIDAGAGVVIGHGPHMLRPIEIYAGRPILYSLGNFMFMFETVQRLPSEMYERHSLGPSSSPSDVFRAWAEDESGQVHGFHADKAFWHSVVPRCEVQDGVIRRITLRPISLGLEGPRTDRGVPRLAGGAEGREILEGLKAASQPLGTYLRIVPAGTGFEGCIDLDA